MPTCALHALSPTSSHSNALPDFLVLLESLAAWGALLVDCRGFSEKLDVGWWEKSLEKCSCDHATLGMRSESAFSMPACILT